MADESKREEKGKNAKPQILDMGLGSREEGFKPQRPRPKLVDREP